jgi:EAL domain-containing protein (putative c-di-GMP-specific phosphodiesterase class I)
MADYAPERAIRTISDEERGQLDETLSATKFKIVYQPIVDLKKRAVFAYEALVRAELFKSPPALIDCAVRAGRLGELGRAMREKTVADCSDHPLFVNIHPDELNEFYLVQPDDPIFRHPEELYLELTEAVPLSELDVSAKVLREIGGRGVHVVVDDLGSGYSNLRYLADLKPKVVKIDRELVTGLQPGSRRFTLMRNLVRMCIELQAMVVAEGIETPEELSAVIDAGAHFGQGYVLARPAFPPPRVHWPL